MPEDPTKQEVHVTELAGPDDRWVSVTDASRIARRQEHTVRTWIAQGRLAVNPVRVGINKKTRQVRLSDLAKLTPIIDPDAGIATDLGTLDLPSIPKQQQQVMEQMAALQQEVTGATGEPGRAVARSGRIAGAVAERRARPGRFTSSSTSSSPIATMSNSSVSSRSRTRWWRTCTVLIRPRRAGDVLSCTPS